jgi:hypothetical protein
MTNILLISEDYIKTNSGLNDNIWGDYLTPAIREAQDMRLQTVLGTNLYNSILEQIDTNDLKTPYKVLLDDYIQIFLMYQTISDLVPIIGVKLANIGVVVSNDEHVQNLSQTDRELVRNYYETRADFYCRRLQQYIAEHYTDYPELTESDCNRLRENLKSSTSTGLWLGGLRGQKIY